MKKLFGIKSKIYLIIFLVGNILLLLYFLNIKFVESEYECVAENAVVTGYIESPIFDFGENNNKNITKFIWKGFLEAGSSIKFTLQGGVSSYDLNQYVTFSVPPYQIYTEEKGYLLSNVRYLKYRIDLYKCEEDSIPRVDKIFIYYSK